MDLKQLYQDIILEHGKSPRNLGKCKGYSHEAKGYNPLCGDKVHIYLKFDNGKKVEDFKTLSTTKMIPMLVNAIQELSAKVKTLEDAG